MSCCVTQASLELTLHFRLSLLLHAMGSAASDPICSQSKGLDEFRSNVPGVL